jgi:hypothetical protein
MFMVQQGCYLTGKRRSLGVARHASLGDFASGIAGRNFACRSPPARRIIAVGMRTFLLLALTAGLALCFSPTLRAQARPLPIYTDAQAAEHEGEEAQVTGQVSGISKLPNGPTFLNLGGRFPNHAFSGVIFSDAAEKVGDVQPFEGKTVTITGRIAMSKQGKPQIVIKSAEQIRLAGPGGAPAPMPTPPTAPAPTPAAPTPATPAATQTPPAAPGATRKIALASNWDAPLQSGTMTRKDLALLFAGQGASTETPMDEAALVLFGGIPYLAPLLEARKRLNLDAVVPAKSRVTCPGLPTGSFTAHAFSGVFEGGFNRLVLVTDNAEQVVSVLVLDENSRQFVANEPDATGYHTYNFVQLRVKGTADLAIRHKIAGNKGGVVVVETMLIDPSEGGKPPPRSTSSRPTTTRTTTTSKTGKVLERSRWYVPVPVVDLILRCAAGSR